MVDGCELLSMLIAKVPVLKCWVNLSTFQPEGRSPFRLRATMATRVGRRIGGLNASGNLRRWHFPIVTLGTRPGGYGPMSTNIGRLPVVEIRSDIQKTDRLDRIHFDLTFFHTVSPATASTWLIGSRT